jgi:dolichol-phosphate mannosyltransferase
MLSAVVPVYNEASSLVPLHGELNEVMRRQHYELEIILVDDGSTDGTWEIIRELASTDRHVRGIRLRRNFGKAAALDAGFAAARGEIVVTLDADLQDDPNEIPALLEELKRGLDVVSGWKKVRHDSRSRIVLSRIFNWLVGRMTGVPLHDHNCGLKAYRHEVLREIRLYGELHRFIPVLAAARGFRVGERVIQHRPRRFGKSKYGMERVVKGFLDLLTVKFLTGFGQRPLHLLGAVGLGAFLTGLILMVGLAAYWVISRLLPSLEPIHLHQRAALYYSLALLIMGGQFLSIGILAELITAYQGRDSDAYSVAERTFSIPSGTDTMNHSPTAP